MAEKTKRNRGFGAALGQRVLDSVEKDDASSASRNELAKRGTALSKMAGEMVYSQSQWVDPAICKPSPVNARDYEALTFDDCADLIETIKSEGQQRTAATVRPTGDEEQPYEIVAGLRRHWSISWLRANNYPDFKYLITVHKMDDETAFRHSDLENRARTDITDLERARSYRDALDRYYGGDRTRMAERIGISLRNLNRYILLAEIDPLFIEALGGYRAVRIKHAEDINSAAKTNIRLEAMKAEAALIADEQRMLIGRGEGAIAAPEVLRRLVKSATESPKASKSRQPKKVELKSAAGKPMLNYVPGSARTAMTIKILPGSDASPDEIKAALAKIVDEEHNHRA